MNRSSNVVSVLLSLSDLCVLEQYAELTGVRAVRRTPTGVRGRIEHAGESFDVALVVRAGGMVDMVCLTGPSEGELAEVSSLAELRAGLENGSMAAARALGCGS
jgi:hypothetical protein